MPIQKKKKKKKKKKKITSASLFGHILVQSGWSAVALVIIIYSRQSVWFYVFYSTKNWIVSFLNRKLLSAEVNLTLGNFSRQYIWWYFSYFFQSTEFDFSCKLSLFETIFMKCQIQFPGKNKKIIQNVICWKLMFSTFWEISADNILMIRLFFF